MSKLFRFTASLIREDGGYVAQCLEVDVASQGQTVDEAIANLKEALELFYEDETLSQPPSAALITQVDVKVA